MNENKLLGISKLIDKEKIKEAQIEVSRLGSEYYKNPEYLYIRGKLFYKNELYYAAIDTLLVASEFGENNKIYELLSEIYNIIGNAELSSKILDTNLRLPTVNTLKSKLSGIYRK
jgi:uncharacterized protein HemY